MKKKFLLFLSIMLLAYSGFAQAQRTCGTTEYMNRLFQEDPGYKQRLANIDKEVERWIKTQELNRSATTVITIPVVVHVVYNNAVQNISDARIISQIEVLNEDFRRYNSNTVLTPIVFQSVAADTEIEFCLAVLDPNGDTTTGIVRTPTTETSFILGDKIKYDSTGGSDAWPSSDYLNIWVGPLGNSLLGYAQFPGSGNSATDGVVILHSAFGRNSPFAPYNLGRTTTHEVGHWFNLQHIWGDTFCGNDQVNDTPTQQSEHFGCPSFPAVSCGNGPNGDMFMNYMDYTDDACMNLFTAGQKARMQAVVLGTRSSLLSSGAGCKASIVDGGISVTYNISSDWNSDNLLLNIQLSKFADIYVELINLLGQETGNYRFENTKGGLFEMDLAKEANGIYFARIIVENQVFTKKIIKN